MDAGEGSEETVQHWDVLGHAVRRRRVELGFSSQQEAADKAQVAVNTWQRLEAGGGVRMGTLAKVAYVLGWTASYPVLILEGGADALKADFSPSDPRKMSNQTVEPPKDLGERMRAVIRQSTPAISPIVASPGKVTTETRDAEAGYGVKRTVGGSPDEETYKITVEIPVASEDFERLSRVHIREIAAFAAQQAERVIEYMLHTERAMERTRREVRERWNIDLDKYDPEVAALIEKARNDPKAQADLKKIMGDEEG